MNYNINSFLRKIKPCMTSHLRHNLSKDIEKEYVVVVKDKKDAKIVLKCF